MPKLGKYTKTPTERKRYEVDYTDWLDTGETLSSVAFSYDPDGELEVDASSISASGLVLSIFVSGGEDGTEYTVTIDATTSGGQVKQDQVIFAVDEL